MFSLSKFLRPELPIGEPKITISSFELIFIIYTFLETNFSLCLLGNGVRKKVRNFFNLVSSQSIVLISVCFLDLKCYLIVVR